MSRLNGTIPVLNWYTCELCKVDLLVNEREAQCCQEIEGCLEALGTELVLQEGGVSEVLPIESIYYILLVYGYLGKRRIPLPACAYHAIRQAFGGKDFKGFEDDEELE
ncbi:Hypothetical predicted protein [Paramuricea clavata]|uniref:Uncharacterized protein n=1 Tax=Paramuricea clavata TaxID=317549 RepID=A0A7D9DR71_PARCT|nr:Hypothetical predicted protein [Paramuricea clavata]